MPLINKRLLENTLNKHRHAISGNQRAELKNLFKETLERIDKKKFKKEESEKVPFLQRLFELLGYKLHENLEFEFSTSFGRSIDAVLGETPKIKDFDPLEGVKRDVQVAIEWKGIDTKSLDKGKAGETPVSQMWDYMGKVGAEIGIVGNFIEWRLYTLQTKQSEYFEFNLRNLTENDNKLDELIFLLRKNTLLKEDKKHSLLLDLINQSEAEQEQITKRFYNDYKQRRTNLFNHLIQNNPEKDKHLLLEKTQKVLDRLIFIMFCEDGYLINNGTIKNTYQQARNTILPTPTKIWDFYKGLFLAIDKGNDYPKINAFNGGLFSEDLELNSLIIKDEIWADLIKLSQYDFESDLNVNILGHIFEQSISDIEEIKEGIEVAENFNSPLSHNENGDLKIASTKPKTSKRKKDGIYYTPEYITDYIVSETVGKWLGDQSKLIISRILTLKDDIVEKVHKIVEIIIENESKYGTGDIIYNKIYDITIEELLDHLGIWYFYNNLNIGELNFPQGSKQWQIDLGNSLAEMCQIAKVKNCYSVIPYLEKLVSQQNPLQSIKILDPAGGSGAFPNQVHSYLAKKTADLQNQEAIETGLENLAQQDSNTIDKGILKNNIFMVDLQPESVEIAKLSLWLKTARKDQKLNNLDENVKCGNSLISDPELAGERAFDWHKEFPEVMASGGFDVVVGNPPYGVKLSQKEQEYLLKKYDFGTTETAILFILKSLDLLNDDGYIGFIIPKSFCFASNYAKIRELVWDNVVQIVDCGKVWEEVKLEQIIVIIQKGVKHGFYINKIRNGEKFENEIKIDKNIAKEFGFFLNGISKEDIQKAQKIKQNSIMLNDIAENRRGAMLQKFISNEGELEVIGGAEISRNGIIGIKGKIKKADINDEKSYIKSNSILVQRIIAHIENPEPHIKITACIPEKTDYILVDTINQITLKDSYSAKFVWAVLNSETCNWYVYNFVLGKAIRTMQFDNPTTSQLPTPKATPQQQTQIAKLVDKIMELKKESQNLTNSFLKLITAKYKPTTISTKLKNWHKLEIADFLDELKKQKAVIGGLSLEAELMAYFDEQKGKVLELEKGVERVDNLIENEVRILYEV